MRGLDTNVLLRVLTADDPVQSPKAKAVLSEAAAAGATFYISTVVLCELVWVLRAAPYGMDRAALATALSKLLDSALFEIQEQDSVRRAVEDFRQGRADFADYLLGRFNQRAGCADTLTFDRRLARDDGYTLLD
jgi:predicted nucleic-acid-binding protein